MRVVKALASLALSQLAGERGNAIVDLASEHFSDGSLRLPRALQIANERAWRVLELSLVGPSFWGKCKQALSPREERALQEQVRAFLKAAPQPEVPDRERCLRELQAARKAQIIPGGRLDSDEVVQVSSGLARYDEPQRVLGEEMRVLDVLAAELSGSGYARLARLITLRPPGGRPLLVVAVRYFFRREVESDSRLSAGLMFQQVEELGRAQAAGFEGLRESLDRHGDVVTGLLEDIHDVVTETRDDVRTLKDEMQRLGQTMRGLPAPAAASDPDPHLRDVKDELQRQARQLQDMYALAQQLMQQLAAKTAVPGDVPSSSVGASPPAPGSREPQPVAELIARFRAMPKEQQGEMPALRQAITTLALASDRGTPGLSEAFRGLTPSPPEPAANPPPTGEVVPAEPTGAPMGRPGGRPVKRAPLSQLFGTPSPNAPAANPVPVTPPPSPPQDRRGKRLISPIFLQPDEEDKRVSDGGQGKG